MFLPKADSINIRLRCHRFMVFCLSSCFIKSAAWHYELSSTFHVSGLQANPVKLCHYPSSGYSEPKTSKTKSCELTCLYMTTVVMYSRTTIIGFLGRLSRQCHQTTSNMSIVVTMTLTTVAIYNCSTDQFPSYHVLEGRL